MISSACACGKQCRCKNCLCSPQARCFDALGSETRLRLVMALRPGPRTVTQLINETGVEQSLASHSLKRLEACNLVASTQEGKHRVYRNAPAASQLLSIIETHLADKEVSDAKACCCH